jgi:hypothetical protein
LILLSENLFLDLADTGKELALEPTQSFERMVQAFKVKK